jgi:hypothetical protein
LSELPGVSKAAEIGIFCTLRQATYDGLEILCYPGLRAGIFLQARPRNKSGEISAISNAVISVFQKSETQGNKL